MKVYYELDEWYPVVVLSRNPHTWDTPIDLTEDEFLDFQRTVKAFRRWQYRLSAMVNIDGKPDCMWEEDEDEQQGSAPE